MENFETNKTHPNAEWRPWDHSKGPTSIKGKLTASKNSKRHGFYCEVFREFRKSKRMPETIQFEWKCLRLIRTVDSSSFIKAGVIIDELGKLFLRTWNRLINRQLSSCLMLELKYITVLYERSIRYSLGIVLDYLTIQKEEQHGS